MVGHAWPLSSQAIAGKNPIASLAVGRLHLPLVDAPRHKRVRGRQKRRFPGRSKGTDLVNPDFVALARSFGAKTNRSLGLAMLLRHRLRWVDSGMELCVRGVGFSQCFVAINMKETTLEQKSLGSETTFCSTV